MNKKQLLLSREYQIDSGWYGILHKLDNFNSVVIRDFYNTTSSAGDWEGYIVQKIGNCHYIILFSQENQIWRGGGYKVYTSDFPICMVYTEDKLLKTEVEKIINQYVIEAW